MKKDNKATPQGATPTESQSFGELLTDWERGFDAFANQFMGTEAYSSWMNQVQGSQLSAQKSFAEFMSSQLVSLNLPSREDVIRLGEQVRTLDSRMENIERMLKTIAPPVARPDKRKRPKRTKKPSASSDQ